jgi:hypothetical protein
MMRAAELLLNGRETARRIDFMSHALRVDYSDHEAIYLDTRYIELEWDCDRGTGTLTLLPTPVDELIDRLLSSQWSKTTTHSPLGTKGGTNPSPAP